MKGDLPDRFSIVLKDVPRGRRTLVRQLLRDVGLKLQTRIAALFEREQYGGGTLGRNLQRTTVAKIFGGHDPRRGHRTGRLQRALWNARLWTVRGSVDLALRFEFSRLVAAVPYAGHYQRRKAARGLLYLQREWQREAIREIKAGLVRLETVAEKRPTLPTLARALRVETIRRGTRTAITLRPEVA